MSEIVLCPGCQSKLRWQDFQDGTHVKCPTCTCRFVAPASVTPRAVDNTVSPIVAAPALQQRPVRTPLSDFELELPLPPPNPLAPEIQSSQPSPPVLEAEEVVASLEVVVCEDEETIGLAPEEVIAPKPAARPPRRRKPSSPSEWKGVFTGLGFLLAALGATAVLFLVMTCGGMLTFDAAASPSGSANPQGPRGIAAGPAAVFVLTAIGWLGCACIYGLTITGHVYCLTAPAKHGAWALAWVTLLLGLLHGLTALGGQFFPLQTNATPPLTSPTASTVVTELLALGPTVCGSAHPLVLLFFLRAVALGVEADDLAQTIVGLMILFGLGSVIYLGASGVAIVTGSELVLLMALGGTLDLGTVSDTGIVLGAVGGLGVLVWLGSMVWYINTLFQVRHAVGAYLKSHGRPVAASL